MLSGVQPFDESLSFQNPASIEPEVFDDEDTRAVASRVLTGSLCFPARLWNDPSHVIDYKAVHLIRRLMSFDAANRYTAPRALQHDWCVPTRSQRQR